MRGKPGPTRSKWKRLAVSASKRAGLDLEHCDLIPLNGGCLGALHLFGNSPTVLVRRFFALAHAVLVVPEGCGDRFARFTIDEQDAASSAVFSDPGDDLLPEVVDAGFRLVGRADDGRDTSMHRVPPLLGD